MKEQLKFMDSKDNQIKLTDVNLVKECENYYLSLRYTGENNKEKYQLDIPRVILPLSKHTVTINRECYHDYDLLSPRDASFFTPDMKLQMNNGSLMKLQADSTGATYILKIIETKTQEMTLEEIEKQLGHKVKIVNK